MKYLLDTHALIWFIEGNRKLPAKIVTEIENPTSIIYVSIASIWELSIKMSLNKFSFKNGLQNFLNLINDNGFEIIPVSLENTIKISNLEFIHRDPFDRIIIAQSICSNLTLITKDEEIMKYQVNTLW